jgi:hypothetical protein
MDANLECRHPLARVQLKQVQERPQ